MTRFAEGEVMRFAQGAGQLAGIAGWLLGWRPDEFWRATPAELRAVLAAMRGEDAPVDGVDAGALRRLMLAMPDSPHPKPLP